MRLPNYLVVSSTGVYHFRWKVPKRFQGPLGLKVVKRSLGTRDARVAHLQALVLASRYAVAAQGGDMAKSVDELLRSAHKGRADFEVVAGPHGYTVKTDGSAQDNAAAVEAVRLLNANGVAAVGGAPLPPSQRIALEMAVEKWAKTLTSGARKTPGQKREAVNSFVAWKNSTRKPSPARVALGDLSRTDCAEWVIYLKQTPTERTGKPLADNYIETKTRWLSLFFDWAMAAGYYPKGDNIARGHIKVSKKAKRLQSKKTGWQPFSVEQLKVIFSAAALGSMRRLSSRWVALIALYTGARSNEIAQLELEDFKVVHGVKCIQFTTEGWDKSLKTEASDRIIPIHPDMMALGLWKLVERLRNEGESKLFPNLTFEAKNGPANGPQKAFSHLLSETLKIRARGEGRLGLHSFRKTSVQRMQDVLIGKEYRVAYIGHEGDAEDDHSAIYSKKISPAVLSAQCFPALNWAEEGVVNIAALAPLFAPE
ncbi:TPA: tyrosine-type recombinase/integrase [Stenotrophomonas maltophilia]|nr:DUF6538 domain-containing protein [Stenotrophomonas pavanii]MBH1597641.1 tyrosine-type recombinase/integrase [Stenotrophomonas maltophilia]HDS1127581.1 tyrosine-type recombinase/integrase [Stenotrophomonas maltophilia]HDS1158971.1 tyrosine-type recombinase/integrase [Stenotrophomonas maltophilia]HDS1163955.1 tyrosine-type recombinase/integrase [Stenotrophomonas maltophilia]HDS1169538.1 tyrosine-type recombinase/integrase [Stenotrophomonas maltophilia]